MQTIQFRVENNYIDIVLNLLNSLNSLKVNVIKDISIIDNISHKHNSEEFKELNAFSNHSANLIEEWKDSDEDSVWK